MPIYEYLCLDCRRVSDFLILRPHDEVGLACKRCASANLTRVLSRVNVRLSEETRLERLADPSLLGGLDENDPRSMARVLKKLGPEMGEDFPGEVDQMIEEAMEAEAGGATGDSDSDSGEL